MDNGISSGFHRLGANVNPNWRQKLTPPAISATLVDPPTETGTATIPGAAGDWVKPEVKPELMTREAARGQGFTGNQCDHCGSMRMKIAGHCTVCEDCGTTTGCS